MKKQSVRFFKTREGKVKSAGGYMWIDGIQLLGDIDEAQKIVNAFYEPQGIKEGDTIYYEQLVL